MLIAFFQLERGEPVRAGLLAMVVVRQMFDFSLKIKSPSP